MPFVYLLKSLKDFNGYIGSTPCLLKRVKEHQTGRVQSTRNRRPLKLVGFREIESLGEARILERKYKNSHDRLDRDIKSGVFKIVE